MPGLNRFNVVLMADTHAGSKYGLRNPDHKIWRNDLVYDPEEDDYHYVQKEYNPPITPPQELLWEKYIAAVQDFAEIAGDDPLFILHLGEVCEGTYYANSSMELRKDEQVQMAVSNMDPWIGKNVKMIRILAGDRPHEFDEGSASRMVVNHLKVKFGDVRGLMHGLLNIGGFQIDYKHKGAFPGSRKWLEGNVARLDLMDHMIREVFEKGKEPADLLVSAHYHEPIEVPLVLRGGKNGKRRSRLLIVPSMKFPDSHAKHYAMKQKNVATVGMSMVEVVNNKILDVHDRFTTVDTRTREIYDG